MKTGDNVLISPQVTGKREWIKAVIIEVEKNPFAGLVITAKTKLGEIFFEKIDMFRLCTQ
jgi:hypothetical protein